MIAKLHLGRHAAHSTRGEGRGRHRTGRYIVLRLRLSNLQPLLRRHHRSVCGGIELGMVDSSILRADCVRVGDRAGRGVRRWSVLSCGRAAAWTAGHVTAGRCCSTSGSGSCSMELDDRGLPITVLRLLLRLVAAGCVRVDRLSGLIVSVGWRRVMAGKHNLRLKRRRLAIGEHLLHVVLCRR